MNAEVVLSYANVNNMLPVRIEITEPTGLVKKTEEASKKLDSSFLWTLVQPSGTVPDKRRCHAGII